MKHDSLNFNVDYAEYDSTIYIILLSTEIYKNRSTTNQQDKE